MEDLNVAAVHCLLCCRTYLCGPMCLKGLGDVSGDPLSASSRELQVWGIFSALWSGVMQCDATVCYLSVG